MSKLEKILDKMLSSCSKESIIGYCFYVSMDLKEDINQYKGHDVYYSPLIQMETVYL